MTKSQIEKKVIHLRKEIKYYCKVYPNSSKISFYKSMYRHYKKMV